MDRAVPARKPVVVGFALLFALLMLFGAQKQIIVNTLDPDLFWHMRVGERLMREGVRPLVDDISFNSTRQPWTPYSWLAEIALARTWRWGGLRAAVVMGAALIAVNIALLGFACYQARAAAAAVRPGGGDVVRDGLIPVLAATAIGSVLAMRYLALRPVTIAFAIIAACVGLLLRDRRLGERSMLVWIVPPLLALGVNVHFFVLLVPMYILGLLAGGVWEWSREREDSARRAELALRWRRYALLAVAALVACTATPLLTGVVRTIYYYSVHDPLVASGQIGEFRPFYEGAAGGVSVLLIVMMLGSIVVGRRRARAGEVLAMIGGVVLLLIFGRMMPIFVLAAAPLLAATMPSLSSRPLGNPFVCALTAVALLFCVYRAVAGLPSVNDADCVWLNRRADQKGYPCEAADYVLAHVPLRSGRMINEFGWGGYLSRRLAGKYQVLIDGRTQVYPAAVWRATYLGSDEELTEFLARADADVAILSREADRFENSLKQLGWRTVFSDVRSVVMRPPTAGAATRAASATTAATPGG